MSLIFFCWLSGSSSELEQLPELHCRKCSPLLSTDVFERLARYDIEKKCLKKKQIALAAQLKASDSSSVRPQTLESRKISAT
jgi:hypothetical protein